MIVVACAVLAAQFSARQPVTTALDVGLTTIRLALPIIAILLLQELLSREFDRKLYLTSLTYPRPRHQFLLGRVAAIALLMLGLLAVLGVLLAGLTTWIAHGYAQSTPPDLGLSYLVTLAFIALDLLVVLAIGTLIAVTTTTPSFVLIGTLGFMLVARSYSAIVALLTRDSTLVGHADSYQSSLSLLGYLLPDLAALDVRMISLYGQWQFLPEDWALRVVSALAYAAALLGLSVWALNRKKFA
ncbi:hypothetical protein [Thauera sp. Sel9]|uniref:hypothetical protein n=1 Tax=Thauera sp. Sel9 TaxID=2974299 RepID=UPI0021E13E3E|nr:hypothetical protein [Thauera sp. Sel9]MCV2219320.1 hypothetical protein [Thauera sp. Sel9]